MYYPIAVLAVAFIVTAILLVKVVPTFRTMFEGFGAKLPAFTLLVLNVSDAIRANGIKVIFTICIVSWFTVRMYRNQANFRSFIQRMLLKIPIFGTILHKAAVARFAKNTVYNVCSWCPAT